MATFTDPNMFIAVIAEPAYEAEQKEVIGKLTELEHICAIFGWYGTKDPGNLTVEEWAKRDTTMLRLMGWIDGLYVVDPTKAAITPRIQAYIDAALASKNLPVLYYSKDGVPTTNR